MTTPPTDRNLLPAPQPIHRAPPRRPNYSSIGYTGLKQYGGTLSEEWFTRLQGAQGMALYREMADNEPVIGAFLFGATMLIQQVPWEVRAADDSPQAVEIAEFFRTVLFEDMASPWSAVIQEAMTMLPFGWSALEIIFKERRGPDAPAPHTSKYTDGRIGVHKLSPRSQDSLARWQFNETTGDLEALIQTAQTGGEVIIPAEKLLHFRTRSFKDSPEGVSALRTAVKPYLRKKDLEVIEAIGIERNLAGYPVVRIPGEILDPDATGALATAKTTWENFVRDLRVDEQHGALIPSDVDPESGQPLYDVKLLSAEARGTADTSPVIERYSREILMSVLADVFMIGHQQTGSFALASEKTDIFVYAIAAWLTELANPFNYRLFPLLMRFNALPPELTPKLTHGDVEKTDVAAWAQAVLRLTQAGINVPAEPGTQRLVRQLLGIPEPTGDEKSAATSPADSSADSPAAALAPANSPVGNEANNANGDDESSGAAATGE